MRTTARLAQPVALCLGILLLTTAAAALADHCAKVLSVTRVPGAPGMVRIETEHRTIVAREPLPARAGGAPDYIIRVLAFTFDSDNSSATRVDTLHIPTGSTVRFQWVSGFHTVTDGLDSGDLENALFDYVLDPTHPVWDTTFTVPGTTNFFCEVHEGPTRATSMAGTIIASASTDVPASRGPVRATFSRLPSPNPTGAGASFAISLSHETALELVVHDVGGRVVSVIARGSYGAGEHSFAWNGQTRDGVRAAAGRYIVRLRAGEVTESRPLTLLR